MRQRFLGPLVTILLALVLLTSACSLLRPDTPTATPLPTGNLLPQLSGYHTVPGQQLTTYLSTVSGGAALLTGHPELAAAIATVDEVIGCYQALGIVQAQAYSRSDDPLAAGAVAVADRDALLDPANFLRCVALGPAPAAPGAIQPCTANYSVDVDGTSYYVIYAATSTAVCQDFCSELPGCTAH